HARHAPQPLWPTQVIADPCHGERSDPPGGRPIDHPERSPEPDLAHLITHGRQATPASCQGAASQLTRLATSQMIRGYGSTTVMVRLTERCVFFASLYW